MNALKREMAEEIAAVKKQQQTTQQHLTYDQYPSGSAPARAAKPQLKPQMLEASGSETQEPPRNTVRVPVSPRARTSLLVGMRETLGLAKSSAQDVDVLFPAPNNANGESPRFDARQVRMRSKKPDIDEQMHQSEGVRDRLRELLELKREINQFERNRVSVPGQGPPFTELSARSPINSAGVVKDDWPVANPQRAVPTRMPNDKTQEPNKSMVSITSPMQLPPVSTM